jgi:hypothetical protein
MFNIDRRRPISQDLFEQGQIFFAAVEWLLPIPKRIVLRGTRQAEDWSRQF